MNAATTPTGGHQPSNFSVFLLGAILNILAAVDYASLIDYSVKAVAGGIIWLAFKLLSDYLTEKMNKNKRDGNGKD